MKIYQTDTYETWVTREYSELQSIVRQVLIYYGFDVHTHIDSCVHDAASTIERRGLLSTYNHSSGPDAWNYMMRCLRYRILQHAETEERMWPSVTPIRESPDSYDCEDADGLYRRTPPELRIEDLHEPLDTQEYLGYLSEMSDPRAASLVVDRMAGYADAEIEGRHGYSHTLTKRFVEEAQVAYCQYTGMHIEPGPKERVVFPEAYTCPDTKLSRRRQRK